MAVFHNPDTGEIYSESDDSFEGLTKKLLFAKSVIERFRQVKNDAEMKLVKMAEFNKGNTARIQGQGYALKIELPSKVAWDQKKLSNIYSVYPHGTIVDSVVKIASYKVDMREYKKIVNTVGNEDFNKFREELVSANLGVVGSSRFTIEK